MVYRVTFHMKGTEAIGVLSIYSHLVYPPFKILFVLYRFHDTLPNAVCFVCQLIFLKYQLILYFTNLSLVIFLCRLHYEVLIDNLFADTQIIIPRSCAKFRCLFIRREAWYHERVV